MSTRGRQPNPYQPGQDDSNDRELFVTTDLRNIPAMELRPMCGSFSQWLTAVIAFKILRAKSLPTFACELRRLVKVDEEQVPKRIMKRFDQLRPKVASLGFAPNYYASVPAIGPIAVAVMTMSREDGQVHFFATQIALQEGGKINDNGHFGFGSRLADETSVLTVSPADLPKPRRGVDRQIISSDDPAEVFKKHRERIRGKATITVAAEDMFAKAQQESRLETEDMLRRRIIRPATAGEITRIRNESRV